MIFREAVQGLIDGYSLEQLGIDPDSRLAREAAREAWAYRRSEVIEAGDLAERRYLQARPGRRDQVWRRYFGY